MKIIKEFTTSNGKIVRVAKVDDDKPLNEKNMIISCCDIEYINKTLDDDTIKMFYNGYVNNINKKNKTKKGNHFKIVSFDKYKQLIINDYMLKGIPYKNKGEQKLLED